MPTKVRWGGGRIYISVTRDNNQYDMATLFAPWIIMVAVVSTSTYVDSAAVTCAAAFAAGATTTAALDTLGVRLLPQRVRWLTRCRRASLLMMWRQ